jgi:hypothetical protein
MEPFLYQSIEDLKQSITNKEYIPLVNQYQTILHNHKKKHNRYTLYNINRGIITAAGGNDLLLQSFVSINLLRHHGCNLPIELYYADNEEMTVSFVKRMETLNVSCINVQDHHLFKNYNARNFSIKSIALFLSSFDETIWMDVDIIPFTNMESLFDHPYYKKNHYMFFPDIFTYGKYQNAYTEKTNELMKLFGFSYVEYEHETDAGLFVINKSKIPADFIVMNLLFNINHNITYKYAYGDKELYNLCMKLCGILYSTNDINVGIIGKYFEHNKLFCGNAVLLKKNDLDHEDSVYCAHMTLHNISHIPKYKNIWTKSIWTHYVTKPVDITLTVVQPINQELLIKNKYETKFVTQLSKKIKDIHTEMYLLYKSYIKVIDKT